MSVLHALDARIHETLAAAGLSALDQDLCAELCEYVVTLLTDPEGPYLPHPGRVARSSVHLFLTDAVPNLAHDIRGDLARLCEVAVVCGL